MTALKQQQTQQQKQQNPEASTTNSVSDINQQILPTQQLLQYISTVNSNSQQQQQHQKLQPQLQSQKKSSSDQKIPIQSNKVKSKNV
jgi:hypothetical protein